MIPRKISPLLQLLKNPKLTSPPFHVHPWKPEHRQSSSETQHRTEQTSVARHSLSRIQHERSSCSGGELQSGLQVHSKCGQVKQLKQHSLREFSKLDALWWADLQGLLGFLSRLLNYLNVSEKPGYKKKKKEAKRIEQKMLLHSELSKYCTHHSSTITGLLNL